MRPEREPTSRCRLRRISVEAPRAGLSGDTVSPNTAVDDPLIRQEKAMTNLKGKTAVVTGSTSGIGLTYARAFAGAGPMP